MSLHLSKEVVTPPRKGIVTGQRVSPELHARTKELRQKLTPTELLLWQHLRVGRNLGYHGKKPRTRCKLTLAYRRLSLLAQSPLSDRKERHSYGGDSPYFGFFLGRTPQLAAGFFTSGARRLLTA